MTKRKTTSAKTAVKKQVKAKAQVRSTPPRIKNNTIKSVVTKEAMESVDPFVSSGASTSQTQVAFASEQGRRGGEVLGLSGGPKTTSIVNSTVARRRSRHAVLTNPYAKRAIDILTSNVVGSGHRLVSEVTDKKLRKEIEGLWEKWTSKVDISGKLNFGGVEALAFRSMLEGGDSFAMMRTRKGEFAQGLDVPLQLQLFEAEQVPVHMNKSNGKNKIVAGIEFTPFGSITRYHMFKEHPGEFLNLNDAFTSKLTSAVNAADVLHMHDVRRPNEVRGLPVLSQALIQLSDFDRYNDAELVRKKAAALIGGFITYAPGTEEMNAFITDAGEDDPDNEDVHIEAMEPGTFPVLPQGYDVRFSEPADVGGNYKDFLRQQLLMISASVNITYEQLTGDIREVNDRTIRAAMLEFKRIAINYQKHIMVHQFCMPIYNRWIELAVISGAIVLPAGVTIDDVKKVKWVADPWVYLNPQQEVQTKILEVRAGFTSRSDIITERGDIPEEVDERITTERSRERDNDLVLTTNAGVVSNSGVAQSADPLALLHDEVPTEGTKTNED